MRKIINFQPQPMSRALLGALPLLAMLFVYLIASDARLAANDADKLLPGFDAMFNAIDRMAFTPSPRTGEYLLWTDTAASLLRLLSGAVLSAIIALTFGLFCGALPAVQLFI